MIDQSSDFSELHLPRHRVKDMLSANAIDICVEDLVDEDHPSKFIDRDGCVRELVECFRTRAAAREIMDDWLMGNEGGCGYQEVLNEASLVVGDMTSNIENEWMSRLREMCVFDEGGFSTLEDMLLEEDIALSSAIALCDLIPDRRRSIPRKVCVLFRPSTSRKTMFRAMGSFVLPHDISVAHSRVVPPDGVSVRVPGARGRKLMDTCMDARGGL